MKNFEKPFNILVKFIIICQLLIVISVANYNINSSNEFNICSSISINLTGNAEESIKNCTIIYGNVVVNGKTSKNLEASKYALVNLREITGYLIVFNATGLKSLAPLFPNLALIRGKNLVNNYALIIYDNPDLNEIGLKSLLALERGYVFVDFCPKLCNANKIFWNRLTLSKGNNYINVLNNTNCPNCYGCLNCWGEKYCQYFDGYDLINNINNNPKCHEQCFGGCFKPSSNEDCYVCKNYRENKSCVENCSNNTYTYYPDRMCYTAEECINFKNGLLYQKSVSERECVKTCPYGFKKNDTSCIQCPESNKPICYVKCPGSIISSESEINSLEELEKYKECHVVEGALIIRFLDPIDSFELERYLGDIRKITHYLQIYDSPYIQNLKFLKNLQFIFGNYTYKSFSLLIHQNKNLTELWELNQLQKINISTGGVYINSNPKLCNKKVQMLQENIKHKKELDFIHYNDEEFFCDKESVELTATVSHLASTTIKLEWNETKRFESVSIFYREVPKNSTIKLDDDLKKNICQRTSWTEIKLKNYQLSSYTLTNLIEHTRYAFIVKLFNSSNKLDALQSDVIYAETEFDELPEPPKVYTTAKMYSAIGLGWDLALYDSVELSKIMIDYYEIIDNETELDTRNFCQNVPQYFGISTPDNQTCYYEKTNDAKEDEEFEMAIQNRFQCSMSQRKNCDATKTEEENIKDKNSRLRDKGLSFRRIQMKPNKLSQSFKNLNHATLYAFKIYFCNDFYCGPYTLYFEETNRINDGNVINNITITSATTGKKYSTKYSIKIQEPENPNGAILNYKIFFKEHISINRVKDSREFIRSRTRVKLLCLQNIEMQRLNHTIDYDPRFNFTISVMTTTGTGPLSPLFAAKNFNITSIIDDTNDDTELTTGSESIEIISTIIVIAAICGLSWWAYRKYPKLRAKIYYNVQDDRVNLIHSEFVQDGSSIGDAGGEMQIIGLEGNRTNNYTSRVRS